MLLIGYLDSPFVRRTAITAAILGVPLERRDLSIFRDFDEFRRIQPMVKVPTLITDDGEALTDSGLIIRYLETKSPTPDALAVDSASQVRDLQCTGAAMVAMEKGAQLIYETSHRPSSTRHPDWIDRLQLQLRAALDEMERHASTAAPWICGDRLAQADISAAVAWGFVTHSVPSHFSGEASPALAGLAERAERLPEFQTCSFK